jgi:ribose transport system permease protein
MLHDQILIADLDGVVNQPAPDEMSAEPDQRGRRGRVLEQASTWAMPLIFLALVVGATIAYPGFLDTGNIRNILSQNAPVGVIALAMTLIMVGGGFDLSVGATFGCGSVAFAALYQRVPEGVALALVIVMGMALGAVNGLLVTRVRVNPFVATLGTGSIFGGAALIASGSSPIIVNDVGFTDLGQGGVGGVPYSIWILLGVTAVLGVLLSRSVYGHLIYAVGGNYEASRLAGLRVDLVRASTYMIGGAAAAFGGAVLASRLSVGQADVGAAIPLEAIAMVVIGGTSLFGGEGSILRTCTGIGILAVVGNVANTNGWGSEIESVVQGTIVIAAVSLDAFVRSRRT